jgi:tetratricopeptide (TPR) repeat protein
MPAEVLTWMAELSADFGRSHQAALLIDEALVQGATPAVYWQIRRELLVAPEDGEAQKARLEPYANSHPLAQALLALLSGSPGAGLDHLDRWSADGASAGAFKTAVRCQLLAANQDVDSAVALARTALMEEQVSGPAQLAAGYLHDRGQLRTSARHFADLEASMILALQARDAIRAWKGRSHGAVVIAIKAALALGNSGRAWELSQPEPDGEATREEASHSSVRGLVLILAAESRSYEEFQRALADAGDSPERLEAEALAAGRKGDDQTALDLWKKAASRATHAAAQYRIGFQIAIRGVVPDTLDALTGEHEDQAAELKLIAEAFAEVPGQLEAMRARARRSRTLAFALVTYFAQREDIESVASTAAATAAQLSDPDLWALAASEYSKAKNFGAAAEAARNGLRVARTSWGNQDMLHATLIEALMSQGHWSEATDAAADMLSQNPKNIDAVWALTFCQLKLGQRGDAWSTYSSFGGQPLPRNEHEASIRIELWRLFQNSEDSLDTLFKILDDWRDSKPVRTAGAYALLFFPDASPAAIERIRTRLAELLASLEDVFVPQNVDLQNPKATLDAFVAQLPDTDTSEIDQQVQDGTLPFGMAASVHHKSYAETLVCRTGAAFTGDPSTYQHEIEVARATRSNRAIIDVTAALSLSLLDEALGDQLLGYVGSATGDLQQRLDAMRATESLSHRSTMTVGRSSDGTAQLHLISDDEAETRFERATRLQERLESVMCVERTNPTNLPGLQTEDHTHAWLTTLDMALDEPLIPLWCDDLRVRQFAATQGISSFGTSALIEAMRIDAILTDELATALQAILITHHQVGLSFRRDWLDAAAELEGWRAKGSASFVRWAPPTTNPDAIVGFVFDALDRISDDPQSVTAWINAASRWLIRLNSDSAESNLVLFLQKTLNRSWISAAQIPFVLYGVREAAESAELTDPFEAAITGHYRDLMAQAGPVLASRYVMGLVSLADQDDQSTANRIILIN